MCERVRREYKCVNEWVSERENECVCVCVWVWCGKCVSERVRMRDIRT